MKTSLLSKSKWLVLLPLMCSCITSTQKSAPAESSSKSEGSGGIVYSELAMRDYDEMMGEIKHRIQSAEKMSDDNIDEAKAELKFALLLILSRPDTDNMVSKLVPLVRTPLKNIDAYESVLNDIVTRAIHTAKDLSAKPRIGATSLIILENFMGELKPDTKNNAEIREIFVKIRDAKIVPSKAVQTEMKMRAMMKTGFSPSEAAKKIIGEK